MAWCRCLVTAALLVLPAASRAYDIPNQALKSLTFELHSVDDDIDLYIGNPQSLFLMYVRPQGSLRPHLDFSNTAQIGVLRLRDLSLFEEPPLPEEELEDPIEEPQKREVAQEWRMELAPSAPASMVLRCQHGKARYDLTGMDVSEVYLQADTAQVRVDFDRPNRIVLDRFKVTASGGTFQLRRFLNARARRTTLSFSEGACELEFTGEPGPGASEVFIEGVAEELKISLRRDLALSVDGPSQCVLRFDRDDLIRAGTALQTPDFAAQASRISLHFSQPIPRLEVEWLD
jgi:hypothetical protein